MKLSDLQNAVGGTVAAFRCRTKLQPADGPGGKVFPPTYAGAVYAVEDRRVKGEDGKLQTLPCVLIDSVQAQANRMEEALQQAIDEGRFDACPIPLIEVDFSEADLLDDIRRVTSLQAPHRIADAILRDSLLDGVPFRQSDIGTRVDLVSLQNATPLYELCPTALIFGMWDSTGPKGGLGAKFQRALVSEIVGVNAAFGIKTSSRIDPLAIRAGIEVWEDEAGNWTLVNTGKKYGRNKETQGKPSAINHGNFPPSFTKYQKGAEGRDPLRPASVSLDYRVQTDNEDVRGSGRFRSLEIEAQQGSIAPGGVTLEYAEQMTVISLPALRRLRFPVSGAKPNKDVDAAGQTVLLALSLCAAALAAERGFDLRSRCLLFPEAPLKWEVLAKPGDVPEKMTIDADSAISTLCDAVKAAEELGLKWRTEPLVLKPRPQLIQLVRRSQELASAETSEPAAL